MITCTHCGNANSDTRPTCQFCGAPLSPPTYSGEGNFGFQQPMSSQQSAQPVQPMQTPELPAWLESLRSDVSPRPSGPSSFSDADFMEEGDLPRWMQSSNDSTQERVSQQHPQHSNTPPLRPSSFSAPNTDEGYARNMNISAHDLIDEQGLPSWMRSEGAANVDNTPLSEQRNISASSLIQPDNVPEWMRNFPQGQQRQQGQQGQQSQQGQHNFMPTSPAASALSYQQQNEQGYPPRSFSAHDLIDPQSLPEWMQEQGNQRNQGGWEISSHQGNQTRQPQQANSSGQPSVPASPEKRFSASSLLDMNSLPSWMREGGQSSAPSYQQGGQGLQEPGRSAASAAPSWQTQGQAGQQNMPPMSPQYTPSQAGGLAASSFIDVNALPEWLRAASEQGQPTQRAASSSPNQAMYGPYAGQGGQGEQPYASQVRPDNMRVPSRPRSEVGASEGSEAAANAFASMLGVASHTPQLSQNAPYGFQAPQSPPPASPQYPNNAFMGQTPMSPMNSGQAGQQASYMNNIGVAQVPPTGAQPMSAPPIQNVGQYNTPSYASVEQSQQRPSSKSSQEKSQKRGGLFEAIRNFFFRQS